MSNFLKIASILCFTKVTVNDSFSAAETTLTTSQRTDSLGMGSSSFGAPNGGFFPSPVLGGTGLEPSDCQASLKFLLLALPPADRGLLQLDRGGVPPVDGVLPPANIPSPS